MTVTTSQLHLTVPVLQLLNYGTPVLLVICYASAVLRSLCTTPKALEGSLSKRRHAYITTLSFIITASFAAQALQYTPYLASAPDDGLVHSISQGLFWVSLSLLLSESSEPDLFTYIVVAAVNLVLQIAIFLLTTSETSHILPKQASILHGFQLFTCLALAMFITLLLLAGFDDNHDERVGEEGRSLLPKPSSISSVSAVSAGRYQAVSSHDEEETAYDSDDESDIDDDKEELEAIQKRRVAETGGWLGYVRGFKVFLPYVLPTRNRKLQLYFAIIIFNTVLMRALNVLHPRQLGIIIDKLTTTYTVPWKDVALWFVMQVAVSNSAGLGAVNYMFECRHEAWSHKQLSVAALDHVLGLSMDFHDQKDSGEIIKAVEQADSLHSLLRLLVLEIAPGALDFVIAMWYVTRLFDVYAALIIIGVGIAFVYATYGIAKLTTMARRLSASKARDESKVIYEAISSWFTIAYFNRRNYIMARLSKAVGDAADAELRSEDCYTYTWAAQEMCEHAGRLLLTLLAARRIVTGASTVGDFVALESYWDTIAMPLYLFSRSYRKLNSDLIDAERLLQLFLKQPTVQDRPDAIELNPETVRGEVEFTNVSFAYPGRTNTLKNFNVHAKPGQTIALVGETGSGKSTILKLLMRFYDISPDIVTDTDINTDNHNDNDSNPKNDNKTTKSSIKIDNTDIRNLTLHSLRSLFGFVPQDTTLFNASIQENIRYAKLSATTQEIQEACKSAQIHDRILSFPQGYDTLVGERGVKLSGGERQRIAIARVFLKNPKVVLLDEATSAMDSVTEEKIQMALKTLMTDQKRTAFVIAHRLSTVVEADCILVVEGGEVVEVGRHHELLLREGGRYAGLWRKQVHDENKDLLVNVGGDADVGGDAVDSVR